jgi:nucleoside-diphosphate-sugar epimerase
LHDSPCTSIEAVQRIMTRDMPLLPKISMPVCDVRDVALAHIKAMSNPDAKNNRHIIVSVKKTSSFKEWALILEQEFKSKNYRIPTKEAPNVAIKFMGVFDKTVKMVNFYFIVHFLLR